MAIRKGATRSVVLSPALARAWATLASFDANTLRRRPGAALAEALGVDKGLASRYVCRLSEAGLIGRIPGTFGVTVSPLPDRVPEEIPGGYEADLGGTKTGSTFGGDVDRKVDRECPLNTVNLFPASVGNQAGLTSKKETGVAKDLVLDHPRLFFALDGEAKTVPAAGVKKAIADLRQIAVRTGRRGPGRDRGPDALDRFLVEAYTSRRRRIQPDFVPSAWDCRQIREARGKLDFRSIGSGLWGRYLDWLFEAFPRISNGCPYPPSNIVKADGFVERFLAELGERRLDADRAARMLRAAGFEGINVAAVLSIAREIAATGAEGRISDPRIAEAVRWILPRLSEVGYKDGDE